MVKDEKQPSQESTEFDSPFPWKEWFLLRFLTVGVIVVLFVIALGGAYFVANNNNRSMQQNRDAAARISPSDLHAASKGIAAAYATLPSGTPLVYTTAEDTCTQIVNGQERIVCFKNGAFARLRIGTTEQHGLDLADNLKQIFDEASWQQRSYQLIDSQQKTVNRSDSEDTNPRSIRLAFQRTVNKKLYCANLVYWRDEKVQWTGTMKECTY